MAVSACTDYVNRRDTILFGAGEAVQTNIAAHVIDPWPAASNRLDQSIDGQVAQRAVERYRNPQVTALPGALPTGVTPAVGGSSAGSPAVSR